MGALTSDGTSRVRSVGKPAVTDVKKGQHLSLLEQVVDFYQ